MDMGEAAVNAKSIQRQRGYCLPVRLCRGRLKLQQQLFTGLVGSKPATALSESAEHGALSGLGVGSGG